MGKESDDSWLEKEKENEWIDVVCILFSIRFLRKRQKWKGKIQFEKIICQMTLIRQRRFGSVSKQQVQKLELASQGFHADQAQGISDACCIS